MQRTNLYTKWFPFGATALLLGILLFVFPYNSGDSSVNRPLGIALWEIWTDSAPDSADYSYCLLVPLMISYLLYVKRKQLAQTPVRGENWGLVWAVIGLVLFWVGARAGKQYIGCAGIQVLVLGLIHWFWGKALFRKLLFTWAILAFAWPLPFLDTAVAFPLRMIVSHSAYYVLNAIGIPSLQSGTALLSAPGGALQLGERFQIDVADPCSGLRSLLPLLMFSSFYCYFFLTKRWHQWTVFLSSILFVIAGNVVRIVMLVAGCLLWGSAFAIGTNDEPSRYHEACGFAVFVIVLGLECLFGSLLIARSRRAKTGDSPVPKEMPPPDVELAQEIPSWRSLPVASFAILMTVVFLVTPAVYLPAQAGVVMELPSQVDLTGIEGGHFYGKAAQVTETEYRILPKDTEFVRKNYSDFHDHQVFFSIVLSGVQQYTIHPPEVCLVAQGWTITGHEDVPIRLESGHQLVVRNLSIERGVVTSKQERRQIKAYYMYWYVADNITTPSHLERNVRSSWDRIFHNRDHRWAYVIAMAPITKSLYPEGMNADQTRELLSKFIRQIVPTFQRDELPATIDNS